MTKLQINNEDINSGEDDNMSSPPIKHRILNGWSGIIVSSIAITMSLFHLYTAFFGIFESILQRSAHLGFALLLTFAIYRPFRKSKPNSIPWYDWILIFLTVPTYLYFVINAQDISSRISYIQEITNIELIIGIIAGVLLLEATRRTVGNALLIIVVACIAFAVFGYYLPWSFAPREFTSKWIVDHLLFTTNGVFSLPIGVSATFIFMFVLFGKFLEVSGAGKFFIDLALSLMGKFRGGPAKTAIVASGIMGSISGSAVANTVTTGAFTIPLMKKTGYKKDFAGAVESVASSGAQIMPPVMGAAAFIIASYLGIPYIDVAFAALVPAILFYICLFIQVDLRARKLKLRGLKKEELPLVLNVLKEGFLFFIPLGVIIYMLVLGYSPMRAGLFAIIAVFLVTLMKKTTRLSFKKIVKGLDLGARAVLETAIACAAAGFVIGVISLTGIGLKFSSLIIALAGGSLLITLILTMITSIILGMGLPTVAAYIVQVALTIPALVELGVNPMSAHLFVFYFAVVSAITPPVALAAFAAAGISGADPMRTGLVALQLGIAAFIVPFMFVYGPSILLIGTHLTVVIGILTAILGIIGISIAVEGWLTRKIFWYERIFFGIGSLLLIHPNWIANAMGLFLLLLGYLLQKYTFPESELGKV